MVFFSLSLLYRDCKFARVFIVVTAVLFGDIRSFMVIYFSIERAREDLRRLAADFSSSIESKALAGIWIVLNLNFELVLEFALEFLFELELDFLFFVAISTARTSSSCILPGTMLTIWPLRWCLEVFLAKT